MLPWKGEIVRQETLHMKVKAVILLRYIHRSVRIRLPVSVSLREAEMLR